eukprot:7893104-Alexandrium_andersonii.AAC.1
MSASLVGSEMCIRDRGGGSGTACRPPPPQPSRGRRDGGLRRPATRPGTVSYTHLTLPTICSV